MVESKMIGLRFAGGPCGLFGLGSGVKIPSLSSFGNSPVSADLFKISAIVLYCIVVVLSPL